MFGRRGLKINSVMSSAKIVNFIVFWVSPSSSLRKKQVFMKWNLFRPYLWATVQYLLVPRSSLQNIISEEVHPSELDIQPYVSTITDNLPRRTVCTLMTNSRCIGRITVIMISRIFLNLRSFNKVRAAIQNNHLPFGSLPVMAFKPGSRSLWGPKVSREAYRGILAIKVVN